MLSIQNVINYWHLLSYLPYHKHCVKCFTSIIYFKPYELCPITMPILQVKKLIYKWWMNTYLNYGLGESRLPFLTTISIISHRSWK